MIRRILSRLRYRLAATEHATIRELRDQLAEAHSRRSFLADECAQLTAERDEARASSPGDPHLARALSEALAKIAALESTDRKPLTPAEDCAWAVILNEPGKTMLEYCHDLYRESWDGKHYSGGKVTDYTIQGYRAPVLHLWQKGWTRREKSGATFRYWPIQAEVARLTTADSDRCAYVGPSGNQCQERPEFGGFCAAHDSFIHELGGDNSPGGSKVIRQSRLAPASTPEPK